MSGKYAIIKAQEDKQNFNMINKDIVFIENPTEDDHGAIIDGINHYASQRGLPSTGGYFFAIYDTNQRIIAAISGFDNFGPAEIGGLWVAEAYRNQGYGKALVQKAEEWARKKGCQAMTVFTLKDWPVCSWYQKLGFTIEFERSGHRNHLTGCYLIKKSINHDKD
ncbi:TPA: GNAT family N-acetyltransferase [Legionella pneumophila subsp. raphaeli]|uniref:GNAT family N-acetyltransferase n=1 Tax=Legionella pneumophila TaxID=446 RepID=UPI000787244D|nr:GNAT family N-acetyltransferase [Legionella pneumophila]HCO4739821.1 GNAT family N-acetyltransferase [Legionella pneumophila]HDU7930396.1 GNAT family N-acetyltransferase [Legionella pneumophila]HDU7936592.1 GNAT family N-acetyltransferase [Legionella pneumophila]HDU7963740.1 GNAT family N-acetyltransferase [Legionella pneumophila]HEG4430473.1 GNAT family N-acetyltransferase [Legionella pneumophila]